MNDVLTDTREAELRIDMEELPRFGRARWIDDQCEAAGIEPIGHRLIATRVNQNQGSILERRRRPLVQRILGAIEEKLEVTTDDRRAIEEFVRGDATSAS